MAGEKVGPCFFLFYFSAPRSFFPATQDAYHGGFFWDCDTFFLIFFLLFVYRLHEQALLGIGFMGSALTHMGLRRESTY